MQPRAALRFALGWYVIAPLGLKINSVRGGGDGEASRVRYDRIAILTLLPSLPGLAGFQANLPSTQVLGYFRPSLRDYTYSDRGEKVSCPCSISAPARAVGAAQRSGFLHRVGVLASGSSSARLPP